MQNRTNKLGYVILPLAFLVGAQQACGTTGLYTAVGTDNQVKVGAALDLTGNKKDGEGKDNAVDGQLHLSLVYDSTQENPSIRFGQGLGLERMLGNSAVGIRGEGLLILLLESRRTGELGGLILDARLGAFGWTAIYGRLNGQLE
ncbi:MAG: hypothetical protein KAY24_05500 [Candidatus Eisenbacteria sp.]|nr:hypothetical protein [Candidatus Eisenbacteria bacterium]